MNHVGKVLGCFSKGLVWASKVSLNSLKLSGDIQSLCMSLLHMAFSQSLIKGFQLCPILKRTDSYGIYASDFIAVKIIILIQSLQISGGIR